MSKLLLNFQVDKTFEAGIERLKNILDFEEGNGITVTALEGDRAGVTLKDGIATVYYHKKHYFFRALGLLVEHQGLLPWLRGTRVLPMARIILQCQRCILNLQSRSSGASYFRKNPMRI